MKKGFTKSFLTLTIMSSLVFAITVIGCSNSDSGSAVAQSDSQEKIKAADAATLNFKLKSVTGEMFDMSSLKGKVLIVDFWDTWCPPCRKGIPEFVEMKDHYKDEDFEIVGIAFGRDGFDTVKDFAKEYKMNYPVLVPDRDKFSKIFEVYGYVQAIPTAFIIDKDGNIVDSLVGYNPKSEFEKKVKPLLE